MPLLRGNESRGQVNFPLKRLLLLIDGLPKRGSKAEKTPKANG